MKLLEHKMVDILADLKKNHNVIGIKAEFEAEGTRIEEAMRLKEIVSCAGLPLTIKIGGCEAVKDMYDARAIGVSAIVAPMIESAFACRKFLSALGIVFPKSECDGVKVLINVETITAYKGLAEMLASPSMANIDGVVIGRGDLSESLGQTRDYINSDEVLGYCTDILNQCKKRNLLCGMGGGVSEDSLPFFHKLPAGTLDFFETRKVQFKCPDAFTSPRSGEGILKAVAFELLWLKNKRAYYGGIASEDEHRINLLESRYKNSINNFGVSTD